MRLQRGLLGPGRGEIDFAANGRVGLGRAHDFGGSGRHAHASHPSTAVLS